MKWDFLKDEVEGKPYESIEEWHKDIKHLITPALVMVTLGTALYFYFRFFHF